MGIVLLGSAWLSSSFDPKELIQDADSIFTMISTHFTELNEDGPLFYSFVSDYRFLIIRRYSVCICLLMFMPLFNGYIIYEATNFFQNR